MKSLHIYMLLVILALAFLVFKSIPLFERQLISNPAFSEKRSGSLLPKDWFYGAGLSFGNADEAEWDLARAYPDRGLVFKLPVFETFIKHKIVNTTAGRYKYAMDIETSPDFAWNKGDFFVEVMFSDNDLNSAEYDVYIFTNGTATFACQDAGKLSPPQLPLDEPCEITTKNLGNNSYAVLFAFGIKPSVNSSQMQSFFGQNTLADSGFVRLKSYRAENA